MSSNSNDQAPPLPPIEAIAPTIEVEKKPRDRTAENVARRLRAKSTAMKKLKVHHRKFVLKTLETNDPKQGVIAAGLAPSRTPAAIRGAAQQLLGSPRIQNALEEKLNELYPDLRAKVASRLDDLLSRQVVSNNETHAPPGAITVAEYEKILARFIQVCGYESAKKSAHVSVRLPGSSLLPGLKPKP